MPHSKQTEASAEQLANDAFIQKLTAFHAERGTTLDTSPRVNGKPIDLQKLYQIVLNIGGYDQVSREKLAWRKVGHEFHLGATNAAAYAFVLKTVYYKNLAAFEIKDYHNRIPPPKAILEDVTAKGGDLLSRTVDNYRQPTIEDAEASGEEEVRTPDGGEKMDLDEPGSGTGRSTRGLRQAPPQRVLFQPDVSSSRQTRTATGQGQSPQPTTAAPSSHPYVATTTQNNMPHSISSYEPRPPMPLTLRGVITPANNSTRFYQQVKQSQGPQHKPKDMTKPGCGYDGPNIYVRTLQALRSGIPAEQEYALHHLVKISHERGDKFKFEAFPMLAEGLVEYILGITSEYYDLHWKVDYMESDKSINVLNGLNGTPGLVERLKSLPCIDVADELEPKEKVMHFEKVKEAGLTMRNLSLMEDNAKYLSEMAEVRDMLTIILSLPDDPRLTELKHYMLDVAEMVFRFWVIPENDPLYRILLKEVNESNDRGAILTALRAMCRISMNLKENNNLHSVPITVIEKLSRYLLLQDEELVGASLDFLYQYTAVPANVAILLFHSDTPMFQLASLMKDLCRLLRYGEVEVTTKSLLQQAIPDIPAEKIPDIPNDLLRQLLQMDEPERSNTWLKCVFEEHKDSEITQIALWQAYQSRFTPYSHGAVPNAPGLLPAAEFIKNVSIIFENATAQVVNGQTSKFIIKGIRARRTPVDMRQQTYLRCLWQAPNAEKPCEEFFRTSEDLFYHILTAHIGVTRTTDAEGNSKWDRSDGRTVDETLDCHWASCHRFTTGNTSNRLEKTKAQLAKHIHVHLPTRNKSKAVPTSTSASTSTSTANPHQNKPQPQSISVDHTPSTATFPFQPNTLGPNGTHNPHLLAGPDGKPVPRNEIDPQGRQAIHQHLKYHDTPVDEHGDPAGLSLTAILVLRNLARNIPKAAEVLRSGDVDAVNWGRVNGGGAMAGMESKEGKEWMEEVFGGSVGELVWCLGYNRTLGGYVADVLALVRKGMGE
ncbi:MAG: hypothetical protein LQ343_007991 [Gyalolechia ehrenbergii]|nr:MAG: hypothetical protein LQ343_007991 [Gyalolechia ehrenbergii]